MKNKNGMMVNPSMLFNGRNSVINFFNDSGSIVFETRNRSVK